MTALCSLALTCRAPSLSTPSHFASQVGEALLGSVSAEIMAAQGPRAEQMLPLANLMEPWAPSRSRSSVASLCPAYRPSIQRALQRYQQLLEGSLGEAYISRGYLSNQHTSFLTSFCAECQASGWPLDLGVPHQSWRIARLDQAHVMATVSYLHLTHLHSHWVSVLAWHTVHLFWSMLGDRSQY